MRFLSYTQAKRYERCGELARQWNLKLVAAEVDQKRFFVGRVVHTCFERWLLGRAAYPLAAYLPQAWAEEEASLAAQGPYALRWVADERSAAWARSVELLGTLEVNAAWLTALAYQPEQRFRVALTSSIGMYAQLDLWAMHPTEPVAYLVELKSGESFDWAQVDWYAAVATMVRTLERLPELDIWGVAVRPALTQVVEPRQITKTAMLEQAERALAISLDMEADRWPARPQGFCNTCEGRQICPDYQNRFGRLATLTDKKQGVFG